jgi:TolA-binding protein
MGTFTWGKCMNRIVSGIVSGVLPCLLLLGCEGRRQDNSKVMATIQGERLTADQFDLLLNTLPPDRKKEILADPEAKRKQFETMLRQRLFTLAAQDLGYGKNEDLNRRLKLVDQRIVTQVYYQAFMGEQLGYTRKELESYFQQHGSSFMGDSGKPLPFETVRTRVADSLAVSKANLESLYTANKQKYVQRAYCEVALVEVKDKKTAEAVFAQLTSGLAFAEAVAKHSIHQNKSNGGKAGRIYPGEALWELGQNINGDSLFFGEGTKLGQGGFSKPFKKDSTWLIVRADSCVPEITPGFAEVKRPVTEEYLAALRTKNNDSALAWLKKKYGVEVKSLRKTPDEAALKAFYEQNKDSYASAETYGVYHLESAKRDLVAKKLKTVKDLEGFKKLAAQVSENAWTKPDSGRSGKIKRDHCLPYGIGVLPTLWSAFDTLATDKIAGPYQNPESGKWHWFYLTDKTPRAPKAFERVRALVLKEYQDEAIAQIKPQDTLAVFGKKVITESDVLFLRQEIPPNMQERYTRQQLVDYLLTWELATAESESNGLTADPKLVAMRLENVDNYWAGIYQDSVLVRTYAQDTSALKTAFAKHRKSLTKDSTETDWKKYARDLAGLATLTEKDKQIEFATYPERYKRDTVAMAFEDSQFEIFQNLKNTAYARAEKALLDNLKTRFKVEIIDASLKEPKIADAQQAYKQAQDLHYDRKLDVALNLYTQLREQFPDNVSLQDSICFGMAQIYIEQERYPLALAEYRRVSYLYPQSQNEYKAQFMVGFIQSEHLKNDSAAVKTFTTMLAKYPKSDLSDDADWMIRNIRSGGKLMPVLEGDSGWVAPDTGKKQ